jgi:RimJ/RimL family protein N-acetyltransferase
MNVELVHLIYIYPMNSILQTERLTLRAWENKDLLACIEMNLDKEVMKYFLAVLTKEQSIEFYDRVQKHFLENGFGLYVVENTSTKEFLGYTGFMIANFEASFTPCVEIGWRFKKQYWGKGYATEAAKACLQYGFDTLGFDKIYSFTAIPNIKSENVMKRIGMIKTGTFSHPKIDKEHILNLHVIYEIGNSL